MYVCMCVYVYNVTHSICLVVLSIDENLKLNIKMSSTIKRIKTFLNRIMYGVHLSR